MADYIYMMETRLSPDQQRAAAAVQEAAQAQGLNVYLTGGAVRDLMTGFPIRDLDFTVQGNPLRLQKDLEKAGATVRSVDEETRTLSLLFPTSVRAEIQMARSERYEKPGRPIIAAGTIIEDLRRRDFTVNAMALSLNPASRGLLLDPANGVADVEGKLLRILHNYSFYEDPSRLIRAVRFMARFHWTLEERTQARFDAAREGRYIDNISNRAIGAEIEQIAHEDDPLQIMRALEKENWMKVLHPRWGTNKVDTQALNQLAKLREQFINLGYTLDLAPAVMYFLTSNMSGSDIAEMQRLIPHKEFVAAWRNLEDQARELSHRLAGKEAATPSKAWTLLTQSRPETIIFLEITGRQSAVQQKIRNFLGKWRQVRATKLPFPEMAELRITPDLPVYPKLMDDAFLLLLDGKLRSHNEILKFLKPHEPPPPPPPPPPTKKRAKAAEAPAVAAGAPAPAAGAKPPAVSKKKKGKAPEPAAPAPAAPAPEAVPAKGAAKGKAEAKPGAAAKPAPPAAAKPASAPRPAAKPAAKPASKPASKKSGKPAKSK